MVRNAFLCVILLCFWGCEQKTAKLQKSVVPPDKTLFETGSEYLKKSQYIKARLAFQTLMNTYPDSEMAPDAVLAIGDSYYDEGGTENLLQAEDSYKNFIVFFPTHPKAAEAALRVIALNHKMERPPDRDQQYSFKTLEAINSFLRQFPDSDFVPIVNQYKLEVQENLALADLGVGQYYEGKGNFAGARLRFQNIVDQYPRFSRMDDVLFGLAGVQEKSNNPEEAAINYGKIANAYPFSKHNEEVKARLNSLGKPVPPVDEQLAAMNQSRVKQPEGFSPLKPFIEFGKALGIVSPPDLYEEAKKAVEETKTAEAAAAKAAGSQAGGDIQVQSTIRKSASGETQDTTVIGPVPEQTKQSSEEKKKEVSKTRKKKGKQPS